MSLARLTDPFGLRERLCDSLCKRFSNTGWGLGPQIVSPVERVARADTPPFHTHRTWVLGLVSARRIGRAPGDADPLACHARDMPEATRMRIKSLPGPKPAPKEPALLARWVHRLILLCGRLPLGLLRHLGSALGRLWLLANFRESRVARRNLELCFPEYEAKARRRLLIQTLRHTGMTAGELPWLWSRDPETLAARIRAVEGESLLDAALAAERGVLIAAPHLGNWEALNLWLSARTPIAILYRPPRHAWVETLINRCRSRLGAEPVRADAAGVRTLLRRLQAGGVVGILPDQQPKVGEGVFAPFFGHPALTMSLFCKLAHRTGARVLYAWAERTAEGFSVHIVDRGVPADEAELNAAIEAQARRACAQYQWTYKRFSLQPGGAPSPYRER